MLWILATWVVTTVATTLIAGAILVTLPDDYLKEGDARPRHWAARIVRNLIGLVLVAVGIALSIPGVPGQGVLTILAGLILIDFPGRHRLVRSIIGRPAILAALNRLRARFKRRPLTL